MATGQKISAMTTATAFASGDIIPIVSGGANEGLDHDVLMEDTQICQAWVNFDGTGTPAISDSFNVSSITDNGAGDYTINLTNALDDTNFSITMSSRRTIADKTPMGQISSYASSVSAISVATSNAGGTGLVDHESISIQVFGGVS